MQRVLNIIGAVLYTGLLVVTMLIIAFMTSEFGAPGGWLMKAYGLTMLISVTVGIGVMWTTVFLGHKFKWSRVLQIAPWLFVGVLAASLFLV